MTQQQYIINRKLNILELSEKLGNITEACRRLGVSRRHYYDIKQAVEEEGIEGEEGLEGEEGIEGEEGAAEGEEPSEGEAETKD